MGSDLESLTQADAEDAQGAEAAGEEGESGGAGETGGEVDEGRLVAPQEEANVLLSDEARAEEQDAAQDFAQNAADVAPEQVGGEEEGEQMSVAQAVSFILARQWR